MAQDFSDTGAFNVNGQWATSIEYSATTREGQINEIELRFKNGRNKVATTTLDAHEAREILGQANFAQIEKDIKAAAPEGANSAKGSLRGKALRFRQVALADYEQQAVDNTIAMDSRVRETGATTPAPVDVAPPSAPTAPQQTQTKDNEARETQDALRLRRTRLAVVPPSVEEKFIKVDERYYYKDKTLAFTDKGTRLKAATHNLEVIRSMVAIAQAREWQSVSVTGTREFRQQTWREASLRGLQVRGYEASELERQELAKAMERQHGANEITKERERQPEGQSVGQTAQDMAAGVRAGVTVGKLMAFGAAPYQFTVGQSDSHYVTVQTAQGEKTLWGVDFERAIRESKTAVSIGDEVGVENLGNRPVTVKVPLLDGSGIAERQVQRNTWAVEQKSYFVEQSTKADALRSSSPQTHVAVAREHPELSDALAAAWLQEKVAKARQLSPDDTRKLVDMVKARFAESIERGEEINVKALRREVNQAYAAQRATTAAAASAKNPERAGRSARAKAVEHAR